ncbi:non-homologous end-joining DNA ligase [Oleiharenicola lentus]|uniref:non-homologous end-joining DNA ligase n=1 Tax=Oleiharenicola lentus TaxID=2508720 RepID=UPI003F674B1C
MSNELIIEGHTLALSNLTKVLYPDTGFTKGEVIRYYIAIGDVLLPHLHGRALTMKRYPDGVEKFFFYEKHCPDHRPKWVRTATISSKHGKKDTTCYCLANNLATLVWMANLAALELHISLARASAVQRPTAMVFDLDPGEGADLADCAQVALWLREKLAILKLKAFPKTSGSKGLQVYVPLNTPISYERTKPAALAIAEAVMRDHPERVVTNMRKSLRRGKVLIDWSQNDDHKTTVAVYSLRAKAEPSVSTPLKWTEVASPLMQKKPATFRFTPAQLLARVKKHGDLFAPVLTLKQTL